MVRVASEREPVRETEAERQRLTSAAFLCTFVAKDPAGNISTWRQQADDDPAKVYEFGYDKTDQLTAAILKSTDPTPVVLKRSYWNYDPAGNRTAEQIDDAVTGAAYNNMNQLLTQAAGGALVFKGTVNEPANVTVGGKAANVSADNRFEGQAVVPSGTGQVQVTATDPSGNVRTNTYEVTQGATSKAFTYDPNGNTTSDGTRTYEWDAENRLVAVKQGGSTVASYTYDAAGIRASRTAAGVMTTYVLEGDSVVEERRGAVTTKHYQGPGIDEVLATEEAAGTVAYLTRDHLGSIRDQVAPAGDVALRRDYDPWGNSIAGVGASGWDFTGRERDSESELHYYRARYYASQRGRFLSEDPAELEDGPNRFKYARNSPVTRRDPRGWASQPCWSSLTIAGVASCNIQVVKVESAGWKPCLFKGTIESADVCQYLKAHLPAELPEGKCPKGATCQNKTPITTWTPAEKTTITVEKAGCRVTATITGSFTVKGELGECCDKK